MRWAPEGARVEWRGKWTQNMSARVEEERGRKDGRRRGGKRDGRKADQKREKCTQGR